MKGQVLARGQHRPVWQKLVACLLIYGLVMVETLWAAPDQHRIAVVTSSDAAINQQVVAALAQTLQRQDPATGYRLKRFALAQLRQADDAVALLQSSDQIVSIGPAAAEYLIGRELSPPLLCALITRSSFESLLARRHPSLAVSALLYDQPPQRLVRLATLLQPAEQHRIGVLLAEGGSFNASPQAFADSAISIQPVVLAVDENPLKKITPVMKASDAFIVLPDVGFYNRLVAKLAIHSAIKHQVPLIGFSKKYADAGALVALYASPEDVGADTALMLIEQGRQGAASALNYHYGQHFSLSINQRLAQAFALAIDRDSLISALSEVPVTRSAEREQ